MEFGKAIKKAINEDKKINLLPKGPKLQIVTENVGKNKAPFLSKDGKEPVEIKQSWIFSDMWDVCI